MQARKSAGERSTLDLKPVRKDTQSPKQEQSVAPQTGPLSDKNFKKKKKKVYNWNKSHHKAISVLTIFIYSHLLFFYNAQQIVFLTDKLVFVILTI